jgi:hypothetical protein
MPSHFDKSVRAMNQMSRVRLNLQDYELRHAYASANLS